MDSSKFPGVTGLSGDVSCCLVQVFLLWICCRPMGGEAMLGKNTPTGSGHRLSPFLAILAFSLIMQAVCFLRCGNITTRGQLQLQCEFQLDAVLLVLELQVKLVVEGSGLGLVLSRAP